ncbi:hypothetical protein BDY24DRAFT_393540 [Mrakia frigida]|uniref:GNAT family N-acetyltransferase n=1 Tax=Mrakia frigida TaxID=29902 RepID=UPI003FCBF930
MSSSSSPNVLWDSELDEPYLLIGSPRFPSSHSIRLTPVRSTDGDRLVHLFNQPEIGSRLHRTPYPYLQTDALDSIAKWSTHISTVSPLLQFNLSTPAPVLKDNIFHVIRLVPSEPSSSSSSSPEETSAGLLVGTIGIWASHDEKTDGDKVGVMDVGYVLLKEFAGKGVVGKCVEALTKFWEVWEGSEEEKRVKTWGAYVETNNPGSLKLLTNLGYEIVDVATVPWPEAKGGGTRESARLERGRFDGKV